MAACGSLSEKILNNSCNLLIFPLQTNYEHFHTNQTRIFNCCTSYNMYCAVNWRSFVNSGRKFYNVFSLLDFYSWCLVGAINSNSFEIELIKNSCNSSKIKVNKENENTKTISRNY